MDVIEARDKLLDRISEIKRAEFFTVKDAARVAEIQNCIDLLNEIIYNPTEGMFRLNQKYYVVVQTVDANSGISLYETKYMKLAFMRRRQDKTYDYLFTNSLKKPYLLTNDDIEATINVGKYSPQRIFYTKEEADAYIDKQIKLDVMKGVKKEVKFFDDEV